MTNASDHDARPDASSAKGENARTLAASFSRVRLAVPVLVSSPEEGSCKTCQTIEIGHSSALLLVPNKLNVSRSLLLINPRTSRQVACQIIYVMSQADGTNHVDVEFLKESPLFWGVRLSDGGDSAQASEPQGTTDVVGCSSEPHKEISRKSCQQHQ